MAVFAEVAVIHVVAAAVVAASDLQMERAAYSLAEHPEVGSLVALTIAGLPAS